MKIASWEFESPPLHYHIIFKLLSAEIAQLVEHNLPKVGVASSSLVFRSLFLSLFLEKHTFNEFIFALFR